MLIGGEGFRKGEGILIPLAIAASFELASVAFEPVLHSTERAGSALLARVVGMLVLLAAIPVLVGIGAAGIAWAVALGSATSYLALGGLAWHRLRADDFGAAAAAG